MNARQSLLLLAAQVRERLPPATGRDLMPDRAGAPARRMHTASTLEQLAGWSGTLELSGAELGAAYDLLGCRRAKDPATRARQVTCQQLAQLCREMDGEPALSALADAYARAADLWDNWQRIAAGSDDPRIIAIGATVARELQVLWAEAAR